MPSACIHTQLLYIYIYMYIDAIHAAAHISYGIKHAHFCITPLQGPLTFRACNCRFLAYAKRMVSLLPNARVNSRFAAEKQGVNLKLKACWHNIYIYICMHIHIYIYMYIYICMHIHIFT